MFYSAVVSDDFRRLLDGGCAFPALPVLAAIDSALAPRRSGDILVVREWDAWNRRLTGRFQVFVFVPGEVPGNLGLRRAMSPRADRLIDAWNNHQLAKRELLRSLVLVGAAA